MNARTNPRLLPVAAALAAALSVAACGDRRESTSGVGVGTTPSSSKADSASSATMPTAAPVAPAVAAADREFVQTAASADMFEVQAGRLALERSKNNGVRSFAQHIVDDHSKASSELNALASSEKIELPSTLNAMHAGDLEKLRGLNGRDFDREFAAQVGVAAHQQAVALFDRASREASDSDIKGFAQKQLPALQEHLKTSQALAKSVGVPADRMKLANSAATDMPSAGGSTPASDSKSAPASGTTGPTSTMPGRSDAAPPQPGSAKAPDPSNAAKMDAPATK